MGFLPGSVRLSHLLQPIAENAFLSFIGYPPVLDAIATLLREERNYYRIKQALIDGTGRPVGSRPSHSHFRLSGRSRTYKEKALPNFIEAIAGEAGGSLVGKNLRRSLYNREEQCARVLSRALNRPFPRRVIEDNALDERYEKAVGTWCQDHPFLDDGRVRNVVFAAFAVTRCTLSDCS